MKKPDVMLSLNDKKNPILSQFIKTICTQRKFKAPKWKKSYIDVIAAAVKYQRDGKHVGIIGSIDGLIKDEKPRNVGLFRESLLFLFEEYKLAFYPLDSSGFLTDEPKTSQQGQVVRKFMIIYEDIKSKIEPRIRALEGPGENWPRKYGRPPYGYGQEKGQGLQINEDQAAAVRTIVTAFRNGDAPGKILEEVRKKHKKKHGKKQFWDYRKLQRVKDNIRLYTLGEYAVGKEDLVINSSLAFLPAEWVHTKWPQTQSH